MILETRGLTKRFGKKAAVSGINMHIEKGDVYGFIGKNGAGKTTFMRLILGLALPDEGDIILFDGEDRKSAGQKIGSIIEAPALYGNCDAYTNLKRFSTLIDYGRRKGYSGSSQADNNDKMIHELIEAVGLQEAGNKKVGHYSLGMKQRLGLAIAMLGDPEFLVLDEPVNGLDPAGIKEIRDTINTLNQERGVTFLISSHLLDELSRTVTRYGIINDGVLVEEISAQELSRNIRQAVTIVVDDPEKAVNIIASMVPQKEISISGHAISIYFCDIPTAEINRRLVESGVAVSALNNQTGSIENYFIERMGR